MKRIKKIVAAVVVIIVVLIVAVFFWIDRLAKAGVEGGATYALGVDTQLDSMDVGVFSGSVAMADLNVANPTGFESPHFLQLGEGRVSVSLGTLMEDKVVLSELTLSGLNLNLVHHKGKANYKVILDNLKKFESGEKKEAAEEEGGKRFVVQKVTVRDVHVEVEMLPIGGALTRVPIIIDAIELENVGSDSDKGILLADLTNIILKAILTTVARQGGDLLPGDIAGELTAGLDQLKGLGDVSVQVVGKVTAQVAEQVTEAAEKVGEEVGKAVEETTEKVGEGLDRAGKDVKRGLGGVLDLGKKDKDKD